MSGDMNLGTMCGVRLFSSVVAGEVGIVLGPFWEPPTDGRTTQKSSERVGALSPLKMVPRVGVEPTLPKEPDFESSASANSAIWALLKLGNKPAYWANARIRFCRFLFPCSLSRHPSCLCSFRTSQRPCYFLYDDSVLNRKMVVDLKVSPGLRIAPPILG